MLYTRLIEAMEATVDTCCNLGYSICSSLGGTVVEHWACDAESAGSNTPI